jgi:hypothetical protein
VAPTHLTQLTLEFDLDADPVGGTVRDGHGAGEAFSGWMSLTRAIELALAAARAELAGSHAMPSAER